MARLKTTTRVEIYAIDDVETKSIDRPMIDVLNHWNDRACIVLVIDGVGYTVVASDLAKAIRNGTNV